MPSLATHSLFDFRHCPQTGLVCPLLALFLDADYHSISAMAPTLTSSHLSFLERQVLQPVLVLLAGVVAGAVGVLFILRYGEDPRVVCSRSKRFKQGRFDDVADSGEVPAVFLEKSWASGGKVLVVQRHCGDKTVFIRLVLITNACQPISPTSATE